MTRERLAELQAAMLPRVHWGDVFAEGDARKLAVKEAIDLDDYFHAFTMMPVVDGEATCVCCSSKFLGGIKGFMLAGADGNATLEWGIAHGEAFCSVCDYPYRVLHYDIGGKGDDAIIRKLTFSLPYHPDELHFEREQAK